jgi:DNA-binding CsgD family transcriptional regulator
MLAELRIGLRSALGDAREAVRLAEEAGDEDLLLRALVQAGHLETLTGGEEWRATLERAQALERRGYTTTRWLAPGHWIAVRLMWADELDQARELLEDEYRQAVEEGDAHSRAGLCFHLAQLETRAGQAAQAVAYADEGWGLNEASGREQDTAVNLYGKAVVEAQFGDADRARSLAQQALATFERLGDRFFTIHTRSALAQLALSLGDHARAAEVLAPAPALRAATEVGEPGIFPFDADEIEALIGVGRVDEAEALTGELERRGRMLDRPRLLATGARCRGLLLAARGDLEGAEGVLETALTEHERLAVPLERGRTLLALGSVRRRLQRKRAARETLERALAIFDEIGTPRWAEQARAELGRIGGRTAPGYGELSATEARIAGLVCSGKTNKEIAATLSLSPRTVQWNLSKVYRKLGVRSRTELAATASQTRPTSGQAAE